ncbi:casein kinase 1, delta subunit [Niveomyces insectorum RCEF 264]|uniref:EKC/KEOPS complex subunit BUD32 n=1 Tax=Niveomyces insectorum RCEF 264 TaxID=1081102 RepID=A0A162IG95_9HYPO|nr:casein kinase 1, delta subunit [Niveomyces insectorum RCEF 264]
MQLITTAFTALLAATALAAPTLEGRQYIPCSGLEGTAQCCSTDVLGVIDLSCGNPSEVPTSVANFVATCAAIGKTAECCTLPVFSPVVRWGEDILVDERFRVDRKIGQGGFGLVYLGTDLASGTEVAMKLSQDREEIGHLRKEKEIYDILAGGAGIPRVVWYGDECDYDVLVHELLGPSLGDLLRYCGGTFSLKTVLLVADQMIARIRYIHSKGYVHRDVTPSNFLLGVGRFGNTIYAIDFGVSEEFKDDERARKASNLPFVATLAYASINNHQGRDDLESLGCVLIYFLRGTLPWARPAHHNKDPRNMVMGMKMDMASDKLCEGLPSAFTRYMDYVRSLPFAEKPDYAYIRKLFRSLFRAKGFQYDNVFD